MKTKLHHDLFLFFIWFRKNGELYMNYSIEKMIDIYIKERNLDK